MKSLGQRLRASVDDLERARLMERCHGLGITNLDEVVRADRCGSAARSTGRDRPPPRRPEPRRCRTAPDRSPPCSPAGAGSSASSTAGRSSSRASPSPSARAGDVQPGLHADRTACAPDTWTEGSPSASGDGPTFRAANPTASHSRASAVSASGRVRRPCARPLAGPAHEGDRLRLAGQQRQDVPAQRSDDSAAASPRPMSTRRASTPAA